MSSIAEDVRRWWLDHLQAGASAVTTFIVFQEKTYKDGTKSGRTWTMIVVWWN